jgi:transcriptional regulator with XRE-family HTH domain
MPPMDFRYLGFAVRRCRILQDVAINDLAEDVGIHRNTLSAYESGTSPLSDEMFVRLCLCLGVDVAETFAGACVAKLELDLVPLAARLREEELSVPAPEVPRQEGLLADRRIPDLAAKVEEVIHSILERYDAAGSNRGLLIRLRPKFLQELDGEELKKRRVKKKGSKKGPQAGSPPEGPAPPKERS